MRTIFTVRSCARVHTHNRNSKLHEERNEQQKKQNCTITWKPWKLYSVHTIDPQFRYHSIHGILFIGGFICWNGKYYLAEKIIDVATWNEMVMRALVRETECETESFTMSTVAYSWIEMCDADILIRLMNINNSHRSCRYCCRWSSFFVILFHQKWYYVLWFDQFSTWALMH